MTAIEVTVTNPAYWSDNSLQLASILRTMGGGDDKRTVPDPTGQPVDPTTMTTLVDPTYWAAATRELNEVLRVAAGSPTPAVPSEPRTAPGAGPATQERLTLTVEEAAKALGISRASAYEAVRTHEIPSVRIGKRILVPRSALERMLDLAGEAPPH